MTTLSRKAYARLRGREEDVASERVYFVAEAIRDLTVQELLELRKILNEGGDATGVAAVLPSGPPSKEGGAEAPFEEWPADYFETME